MASGLLNHPSLNGIFVYRFSTTRQPSGLCWRPTILPLWVFLFAMTPEKHHYPHIIPFPTPGQLHTQPWQIPEWWSQTGGLAGHLWEGMQPSCSLGSAGLRGEAEFILPFASSPPFAPLPCLMSSKKDPEHAVGRNLLLIFHSPFSASPVIFRVWPDCSATVMTMMYDCTVPRVTNCKVYVYTQKTDVLVAVSAKNTIFLFSPERCIKDISSNCSALCTKN